MCCQRPSARPLKRSRRSGRIFCGRHSKAGGWISDTLGPILKNFTSWLGDVTGGVEGITSAIQDAIAWLSDLADTISKLSLPDWLTPGSPTPWEIGLRGIGDALKTEVNPQVDSLFNTLTVAPPASAQQLQAGGGSTTTIDNSRNLAHAGVHEQQS